MYLVAALILAFSRGFVCALSVEFFVSLDTCKPQFTAFHPVMGRAPGPGNEKGGGFYPPPLSGRFADVSLS
jgi:hypothetical protein